MTSETETVIIGAGPARLATAGCLTELGAPFLIREIGFEARRVAKAIAPA